MVKAKLIHIDYINWKVIFFEELNWIYITVNKLCIYLTWKKAKDQILGSMETLPAQKSMYADKAFSPKLMDLQQAEFFIPSIRVRSVSRFCSFGVSWCIKLSRSDTSNDVLIHEVAHITNYIFCSHICLISGTHLLLLLL